MFPAETIVWLEKNKPIVLRPMSEDLLHYKIFRKLNDSTIEDTGMIMCGDITDIALSLSKLGVLG